MGANQSRSFDFYCSFAISISCVDAIETESPSQVYNRLKEGLFRTRKQMEAVSIIIYEKALLKINLSQKCAQLVKELQAEACYDENKLFLFQIVFSEYLMNTMKSYVAVYDDSKMNGLAIQCGKSIAFFIGNLYISDVFTLTTIIEICNIVKQKETPRSKFFIETILSIISKKMNSENISRAVFDQMVINGLTPASSDRDFDDEDEAMSKFSQFMYNVTEIREIRFYDNYCDFKNMSEKALEVEITILFNDCIQFQNKHYANVYCDIALDIHYMRPSETRNCLCNLFIRNIERYEVIKDADSEDNAVLCNILGKTLTVFFQNGLLDERVVEHFLNAIKSPKVPWLIFIYTFINVLTKYRGKNIYNFLENFKKSAKKLPDSKQIIAAVDEYVTDKEGEIWKNGNK